MTDFVSNRQAGRRMQCNNPTGQPHDIGKVYS